MKLFGVFGAKTPAKPAAAPPTLGTLPGKPPASGYEATRPAQEPHSTVEPPTEPTGTDAGTQRSERLREQARHAKLHGPLVPAPQKLIQEVIRRAGGIATIATPEEIEALRDIQKRWATVKATIPDLAAEANSGRRGARQQREAMIRALQMGEVAKVRDAEAWSKSDFAEEAAAKLSAAKQAAKDIADEALPIAERIVARFQKAAARINAEEEKVERGRLEAWGLSGGKLSIICFHLHQLSFRLIEQLPGPRLGIPPSNFEPLRTLLGGDFTKTSE
jgi:hypothetical protein